MSSAFIWFAMSAGAVSLLTPCVFPMIPITVSYFVQHPGADRKSSLTNALVFAIAIIATFTTLGFVLAIAVGATGINRFAANPWVNLVIAIIFIGLAANLLGYFHIHVPSRWLTRLDAATRNRPVGDSVGALLMGFVFTLTSFTCTAPFVGTVLVSAAQGNWQRPLVGMLIYAIVFALPFFLLAISPRSIARLPRSGAWLTATKVVMGILELAAAVKFLSNVDLVWHWYIFTRPVVLALWSWAAIVAAGYVLGVIKFKHDDTVRPTGARLGWCAAFGAIAIWLALGAGGRPMGELESFLPPSQQNADLVWELNSLPSTLSAAQANNQRVFVDFTGYTCTNCRWMEANMFTRPEIIEALSKYRLARLFTDGDGAIYQSQQLYQATKFGTVALPLYAVLDNSGNTISTFAGLTRDSNRFLQFLTRSLRKTPTHN